MNKAELVAAVAAKAEVSKVEAAKVIDAALDAAVEALKNGETKQKTLFNYIYYKK